MNKRLEIDVCTWLLEREEEEEEKANAVAEEDTTIAIAMKDE